MTSIMLTHKKLLELLHYNPLTGLFNWRIDIGYRTKAGNAAGSKHHQGYIFIGIDRKQYGAHRLAWFYMTGTSPSNIDHIDGDRANNAYSNLREASRAQNSQNIRKARSTSSTGLLGAVKNHGRWNAKITVGGKRHYLGTYDTPLEAHLVYVEAKRKLHEYCEI